LPILPHSHPVKGELRVGLDIKAAFVSNAIKTIKALIIPVIKAALSIV